MITRKLLLFPICAAASVWVAGAQTAPERQFTARELFYHASQASNAKPEVPVTPPAKQTTMTAGNKGPDKTASKTGKGKGKTNVAQGKSTEPSTPNNSGSSLPTNSGSSLPDGTRIVKAQLQTAPAPTNGPALGLRYTVLKKTANGMIEVPQDTPFHAGDKIQLSIQTNYPGYLYVVNKGSSGAWKPMFPSPEVQDGNNRVDGWSTFVLPPNNLMVFDEHKGVENVTIVFSREAVPDFESLIYSLQKAKTPAPEPAAQPSRTQVMVASASIDDTTMGRLRKTFSRDLIIEPVTPDSPGDKKETAVYVVNPTGSSDSRLVADLHLVHQ